MYYLQSRYYDANVGRFVNGDEVTILSTLRFCELNFFAYCKNDSISDCDPLGLASYKNTKRIISTNVYEITSVISSFFTKLTYKYKIERGVIRFDFDSNNYWSVLWRGWAKTLAEAMYKASKSISSQFLKGRTISGIHTELLAHWAVNKLGIKTLQESTRRADMGGCMGTGYDSNAWVFEALNIINKLFMIDINALWVNYSFWRELARYF